MGDGMLSLSWNNHASTFSHMLSSLRHDGRFSDVTIACNGKFYSVHKLVLTTCSEYFGKIFEETPCSHPVIILKDVESKEMEALLNYMYIGQVSVDRNDLSQLIQVAEMLQIKGLAAPDGPLEDLKHIGNEKSKKSFDEEDSRDICILESTSSSMDAVSSQKGENSGEQEDSSGAVACASSKESGKFSSLGSNKNPDKELTGKLERIIATKLNCSGSVRIGVQSKQGSKGPNFNDLVDEDVEMPDLSCVSSQPVVQIEEGNEAIDKVCTTLEPGDSSHYECEDDGASAVSAKSAPVEGMYYNGSCLMPSFSQSEMSENNREMGGNVAVQNLQSLTEEAFHSPYFLFSGLEQSEYETPRTGSSEGKSKKRPFACPDCSFSASFEYNLKVHMRTHTGEKPFVCPHCPCRFTQKSHLKNHLFTHTGEKPYVCEFCSMKFSRRSNLRRHLAKHE